MIYYDRVKELSDEMISDLEYTAGKVQSFKRRTEEFSTALGDKISQSALDLAEEIAKTIRDTQEIIRKKTSNVGDFAETLKNVENKIKGKVEGI